MDRLKWILAAVGLGAILVGVHWWRLPRDALVIDFLSVGQGDAILITTPASETILVDGGPDQFVLRELGEVIPFLQRRIDLMILTHPHADHMMGLVQVLKRYDVQAVLFSGSNYFSPIYDEFLAEIRTQNIPLHVAHAEKDWWFYGNEGVEDDVFLDVLFPFESMAGHELENVNNASVVVRVEYGKHRILLTGDAEFEVEEELLAAGIDIKADVLKAGHHGSRTSSSLPFLNAVQPEVVVISCGVDNSFGHPHKETLEKLQDFDVEIHRTDLEGRVRLVFE